MTKIRGLVVSVVLFAVISQGAALKLSDACTNPSGKSGRCVYVRECPALMKIVSKQLKSADETSFIQGSKCGTTPDKKPLVCCASETALLEPPKCGVDLAERLFGGQPTDLDEFPWTALIQYSKPNGKYGFHCGGSLINSRYIVTAAHCIKVIPRGWTVVGVRLGEYDLGNDAPDCFDGICADTPVDMEIEKIIVHEDYVPTSKSQWDDIALIRFKRDVILSQYIQPICLPVAEGVRTRNNVGTKGTAAGWGRTETAAASPVKLKVSLEISDPNRCATAYKRLGVSLRDTQLCAGGLAGKDTCSGDSGGPLMKRIETNVFLYGIVSFGPTKCGTKDIPGVYTNVVKYIDWVQSKLE